MGHSSKAIAKMLEGNYYDNIVAHLRHGIKAPLTGDHKIIFDRIERATKLWRHHKDDTMVVKLLVKEFEVSRAQAYNYLADAKSIFALFVSFNPMAELLLLRERINKAFELAERDPKNFGKLYGAAMLANSEWIKDMRYETERMKPEEVIPVTFIYHTDWTKLPGVTPELMEQWDKEFDEMEVKARSKFKYIEEANDVEYSPK